MANLLGKESDLYLIYESVVKSAEIQKREGNFDQAIDVFSKALNLARKAGDKQKEVDCLINLGLMYWNIGQLEQSSEKYKEALLFAQEINLWEKEQECQNALEICRLYKEGKFFRDTNDYQKSIESFQKAIDLARRVKSKEHELKCLRQLSYNYLEGNKLQELCLISNDALKIAQSLNHRIEIGRCLNHIGCYYLRMNNYCKALIYYNDSLEIAKKEKNRNEEGICLNNIGIIYHKMGIYDKSLEYFERALSIDKKLENNEDIARLLNNLGLTLLHKALISRNKEDFHKTRDYFAQCLELARRIEDKNTEIKVLNNMGLTVKEEASIFDGKEKYIKATKYFESALKEAEEIKNVEEMSIILTNMGYVYYNHGNYERALRAYFKSIELAIEKGGGGILWEAYFGLGQCYEKKNDNSQAQIYYEKAIDEIERIRSQAFLDIYKVGLVREKSKVYESLIELIYRLNRDDRSKRDNGKLFHIIEKAKARAFIEALGESKIEIGEVLSPELKIRQDEISDEISKINQELLKRNLSKKRRKELLNTLKQKEDVYLSLISEMRVEAPGIAELISPLACKVEQLQQLLDRKTALIEYFLGENQSIMFFVTKNEIEVHSLPSRSEVEKSLKAYIKILSDPSKPKFRGILAAKRIYKELLPDIPDNVENLIIVPDGIIYYLPFETLVFSHRDQKIENKYLVEKYKISYIPSSSALLFLSENRSKSGRPRNLLAFGNPSYTLKNSSKGKKSGTEAEIMRELYLDQGFDFSPLPHSEQEVLGISSYFPRGKRDIFIGQEAKEENFKRNSIKDYGIIHFACHGFLSEEYPFRSALVLSLDDDPSEDGFLQVRELYNLRLRADLVVLSACQTGRGRMERGEGLLGLPRIFFYAGAKSVLSTLWKINDESTATFMNWFYRYLSEGKDTSQALRLVKLRMLDSKYSHPFYWASFVLNGDYNSMIDFK